jgi:hypothetical protein
VLSLERDYGDRGPPPVGRDDRSLVLGIDSERRFQPVVLWSVPELNRRRPACKAGRLTRSPRLFLRMVTPLALSRRSACD